MNQHSFTIIGTVFTVLLSGSMARERKSHARPKGRTFEGLADYTFPGDDIVGDRWAFPEMNALPSKAEMKEKGFTEKDIFCMKFDGDSERCKKNHCFYCCTDELCHASSNSAPDCLPFCPCADICDCTKRKCYSLAGGATCSTEEVCSSVGKLSCTRSGEFYNIMGVLCKSQQTKECKYETTNIAINLGGERFEDHLGIIYNSCYEGKQLALFKHRWHKHIFKTVLNVPLVDKLLYQTSIWWCCGSPGGNYSNMCESWNVNIKSDGWYEFVVKTLECCRDFRQFDIRLNGITILTEFGPRQYVDKFEKIDIVTQFHVTHDVSKLSIEGFPTSVIEDGKVPISFCCGRYCEDASPNPHVSAFYVRKYFIEGEEMTKNTVSNENTAPAQGIFQSGRSMSNRRKNEPRILNRKTTTANPKRRRH